MDKYLKIEDIRTALFELLEKDRWLSQRTTKEIIKALGTIPRFEASEDCISRKWLEENAKVFGDYYENTVWAVPLSILEDAPSVVPKERADKSLKKQLKDIKTVGTIGTEEEYGLFGCRFRTVEKPPSVVPSRAEGEWIEIDDTTISCRCSVCGWEAHLYEDDVYGMPYCPNCGARMRG